MINLWIFIATIFVIASILVVVVWNLIKVKKENKIFREEFKPILDINAEVAKKKAELDSLNLQAAELSEKYKNAREIFVKLEDEIKIYQTDLEMVDFGLYAPQFDFDTSQRYKEEILKVVNKQKALIKNGDAAKCGTDWVVSGSQKKGEMMTKRAIKLSLRAFNGECDSLISKVKWNNISRIEQRIQRAFDAINKLNKSNDIYIQQNYLNLKLKELRLTHEYELKKYEEKEEQRRIREEMREEERALQEIEKAKREAEKEERQYQRALEKAQKEMQKAQGDELNKLSAEIEKLKGELERAHDAKERAISRAQLTKSGYVYIISNIGSFGENVYKIGMTRRLEPMDRVRELGDASVPFKFDVHAMIYSENAPDLENKLHQAFSQKKVNMVNNRKEFFNVSLSEIEKEVKDNHTAEIEFTKLAEAQEYRETLAVLKRLTEQMEEEGKTKLEEYPESLF